MKELIIEELAGIREAIELLTKAIDYHARVIGYKADAENPKDEDGRLTVKLDHQEETKLPEEPVNEKQESSKKNLTIDDVKQAVNQLARKDKDAAISIVKKYAETVKLEDIKADDYFSLIKEAKEAL